MGNRRVGHRPEADPTGTFCVVPGCGRFIGKNPSEHRRGSGGRRRTLTPQETVAILPKPADPLPVVVDLTPILERLDALEAIANRILAKEPDIVQMKTRAPELSILVAAINEGIAEPLQNELDEIKHAIANLKITVGFDIQRSQPTLVPSPPLAITQRQMARMAETPRPIEHAGGGWRSQRPDRSGRTRTTT